MTKIGRWAVAIAVCVATGCSGGGDSTCTGAPAVKLSDLQVAVFTPSCAIGACHSNPDPAESLDLETGQTYAATVNVKSLLDGSKKLVEPGNAAASELYIQVSTGLMPQVGAALTTAQVKQVHDWICSGAPND